MHVGVHVWVWYMYGCREYKGVSGGRTVPSSKLLSLSSSLSFTRYTPPSHLPSLLSFSPHTHTTSQHFSSTELGSIRHRDPHPKQDLEQFSSPRLSSPVYYANQHLPMPTNASRHLAARSSAQAQVLKCSSAQVLKSSSGHCSNTRVNRPMLMHSNYSTIQCHD